VTFFATLAAERPPLRVEAAGERLPATVLAENHGHLAGWAQFRVFGDTAYVQNLAIAPAHRRQGIGRALMHEVARQARAAGCKAWCLNVNPANLPARQLYEQVGMSARYPSVALRFDWSLVSALPAEPATVRPLEPREDAMLEARFALLPNELAGARQELGQVLGLTRGVDALAVACFDPDLPAAFPFRVARPSLARPLLEACCRFARSDLDYMQVVVEDDVALAELLVAAGANVSIEITHYAGQL
jgi:predicted GNAT family acetyltransferase